MHTPADQDPVSPPAGPLPDPQPLFEKIDCLRLSVTDLEAGLDFYRDRLGLALIWRTPEAAGLRLPGTDAELVLHSQPSPPEIDLLVASAEEAAARFAAAGGRVVLPPFEIQIGQAALVQDPWGNHLVLLDASKGLLVTDTHGNVVGNAAPAAPTSPSPEDVTIRPAGAEDLAGLWNLYFEFHEFHARAFPGRLRSLVGQEEQEKPRLEAELSRLCARPDAALFLLEVSAELCGLAEVYLRQDEPANPLLVPQPYGYLQSLFVREAYRRRGLGRRLVQVAHEWAQSKGATEMRLQIWEFAAGPLEFYTRLGYRTEKRSLVADL